MNGKYEDRALLSLNAYFKNRPETLTNLMHISMLNWH